MPVRDIEDADVSALPADRRMTTGGALREDPQILMWLLDLMSPVLPPPGADVRRYAVLPGTAAPRYFLPLDARRAGRAVLVRPAGARTLRQRAGRMLLGPALRIGAVQLVAPTFAIPDGRPHDPSLLQRLEQELHERRLVMSIGVGPPRPNRKPVLQLLTPNGRTVCFAKTAVDAYTAAMIANESRFLGEHRPCEIVAPEPMGLLRWKARDIALFSPLDLGFRPGGSHDLRLTTSVVLDIARLLPLQRRAVLDTAWWTRVSGGPNGPDGRRTAPLCRAVELLAQRLQDVCWTFGAWHGDLTPWNAQWEAGRLHVWDWERAGGPVPLGFDVVHAAFQVAHLRSGLPTDRAVARALGLQGGLLARLAVPEAQHGLLVDCYLLELCLRMLDGARFGAMGDLDAVVDDILARLCRRQDTS